MPIPKEFRSLSSAEQELLEACLIGGRVIIAQERPSAPSVENRVRASFLRWLALGDDAEHPPHAHGIQLMGAWIEGTLDLINAETGALSLQHCHFSEDLLLYDSRIKGLLSLQECHLAQGMGADRAHITGSVFLRRLTSQGEICLLGAQIGGDLSCNEAKLQCTGKVLSADRARITGNVVLDGLTSQGEIRLLGAQIGGNLDCNEATLQCTGNALSADGARITGAVFLDGLTSQGEIRLLGAQIDGHLVCEEATLQCTGNALSAEGARIRGGVFLRKNFSSQGRLSFAGAVIHGGFVLTENKSPLSRLVLNPCQISFLQSELTCWGDDIRLDGLVYNGLREHHWSVQDHLDWLNKQSEDDRGSKKNPASFKPQPWQQLIKTLRTMAHDDTADKIAIALQKRLYEIGKVSGFWRRALHWLFGWLAGYGYRPLRLLGITLGVCLVCALLYGYAATQGVMAPSNPLVFQNPDYQACVPQAGNPPTAQQPTAQKNWTRWDCPLRGEYTTFSAFAYSLDVLLPVVDLGQQDDWGVWIQTPEHRYDDPCTICSTLKNWSLNYGVRLVIWVEILYGWVASFILLAILSGITQRQER